MRKSLVTGKEYALNLKNDKNFIFYKLYASHLRLKLLKFEVQHSINLYQFANLHSNYFLVQ
jgi:hypothetical protein